MARKLRLEYAGAVYDVISRGNYRADVFGQDSTKAAFLGCLEEASAEAGWLVHAWCVMSFESSLVGNVRHKNQT
jgi:REP element-mobilizing transposase RayT